MAKIYIVNCIGVFFKSLYVEYRKRVTLVPPSGSIKNTVAAHTFLHYFLLFWHETLQAITAQNTGTSA